MAKISTEETQAIKAGYIEGERVMRAYGKARYANPYLWASRMWEAFEFGYYLQEKGLSPDRGWERGRGNCYRNVDEFTYRLEYGKGKNSFGIRRIS